MLINLFACIFNVLPQTCSCCRAAVMDDLEVPIDILVCVLLLTVSLSLCQTHRACSAVQHRCMDVVRCYNPEYSPYDPESIAFRGINQEQCACESANTSPICSEFEERIGDRYRYNDERERTEFHFRNQIYSEKGQFATVSTTSGVEMCLSQVGQCAS